MELEEQLADVMSKSPGKISYGDLREINLGARHQNAFPRLRRVNVGVNLGIIASTTIEDGDVRRNAYGMNPFFRLFFYLNFFFRCPFLEMNRCRSTSV